MGRREPGARLERSASGTRPHDPELVAGTTAHYDDPAYYYRTYRKRAEDVRYYVDLARSAGGAVLEYGCGNGRITLAIARSGVDVVGVDLSEPMLADLEARLGRLGGALPGRVTCRRGDMRAVRLRRRFPLVICPFNALLHLYERADVERFLARVKQHLAPRGRFVFDVSVPDPSELARKPGRLYRTRPFLYPGVGRVQYGERFDYDGLRQVLFVSMEFQPDHGEPFVTPLAHRQFYPRELEALLHYNGLAIERVLGDFDGKPTHDSVTLAYECRVRTAPKSSRR